MQPDLTKLPPSLAGLTAHQPALTTLDGHSIQVWDFTPPTDDEVLSAWATRFRQVYCDDKLIDELLCGTPYKTRKEFLEGIVFPSRSKGLGPATRAGDFGELLVADYMEYCLNYWVPRDKYGNKQVRDESMKGIDVVGLRVVKPGDFDPEDSVMTFEVKARLTGSADEEKLQFAVEDSAKDHLKLAETLHAMKRRFLQAQNSRAAEVVRRFQNRADRPFNIFSGAAAVLSASDFEVDEIRQTQTSNHWNRRNLILVVFKGNQLMELVHELYRRAADEA